MSFYLTPQPRYIGYNRQPFQIKQIQLDSRHVLRKRCSTLTLTNPDPNPYQTLALNEPLTNPSPITIPTLIFGIYSRRPKPWCAKREVQVNGESQIELAKVSSALLYIYRFFGPTTLHLHWNFILNFHLQLAALYSKSSYAYSRSLWYVTLTLTLTIIIK